MFAIELGIEVKDVVTGFKGKTIAACLYLNGCICYEIQPVCGKDGKMPQAKWIDEQQLEKVKKKKKAKAKKLVRPKDTFRGGPADRPTTKNPPGTFDNEDKSGQGYHDGERYEGR